jgi:hypothetical protein
MILTSIPIILDLTFSQENMLSGLINASATKEKKNKRNRMLLTDMIKNVKKKAAFCIF